MSETDKVVDASFTLLPAAPASSAPPEDEVLTVPEAAKLLRMSVAWVYEMAAAGRLPAYRAGRAIRFFRRSLLEWLEQQKVAAPEPASLGSK